MVPTSHPIRGDIGNFQLLVKQDKSTWLLFQKWVFDRLNMLEYDPTLMLTGPALSGLGEKKEKSGE